MRVLLSLRKRLKTFRKNESGAVTVDWVVLTAGVVGIAGGIMASATDGTVEFADGITKYMSNWFTE